jgi:hypothetical protein
MTGSKSLLQSEVTRCVHDLLVRCPLSALVTVGRDDSDSYAVAVETDSATDEFRSWAWKLMSAGSEYWRYTDCFSVRVLSMSDNTVWVGVEVVVPHESRTASVEGCFGLMEYSDAVDFLKSLCNFRVQNNAPIRGGMSGKCLCNPEWLDIVRRASECRGKVSLRDTDFGQGQVRRRPLSAVAYDLGDALLQLLRATLPTIGNKYR